MKAATIEEPATVWFANDVPVRMFYAGLRWRVTDTPPRLRDSIWSVPLEGPGMAFTGGDSRARRKTTATPWYSTYTRNRTAGTCTTSGRDVASGAAAWLREASAEVALGFRGPSPRPARPPRRGSPSRGERRCAGRGLRPTGRARAAPRGLPPDDDRQIERKLPPVRHITPLDRAGHSYTSRRCATRKTVTNTRPSAISYSTR